MVALCVADCCTQAVLVLVVLTLLGSVTGQVDMHAGVRKTR